MSTTLGQKIKALRKEANLTLRELGEKVNTDFTYLSKIENDRTDKHPPSIDLLKRLAHALKADVEELTLLTQRIPETKKPAALRFFRAIKDSEPNQKFWDELTELAERHRKQKK